MFSENGFLRAISHQRRSPRKVHFKQNISTIVYLSRICQDVNIM